MAHQLFGIEPAVRLPESNMPLSWNRSEGVIMRHSEIPSQRLLTLDCLEQRLEIAGTEALGALPLDDLVEQRRPVFHRLGEYLKQIPLIVTVDENAEVSQRRQVFIDVADAFRDSLVIRKRNA